MLPAAFRKTLRPRESTGTKAFHRLAISDQQEALLVSAELLAAVELVVVGLVAAESEGQGVSVDR